MGFVIMAADVIIMNEQGPHRPDGTRGDRAGDGAGGIRRPTALVWRTTGGKHRYIMGDCDYLVEDSIGAFRRQAQAVLRLDRPTIAGMRKTRALALVRRKRRVALAAQGDRRFRADLWRRAGNASPAALTEMTLAEFLEKVSRLPRPPITD